MESTVLKVSLLLVLILEANHKLYVFPGFYKDAERLGIFAVFLGVLLFWP